MLYQTTNPHGGDIYGGGVLLDFSANTNPFGTPPGVRDAIIRALPELHRYPDPYCRALVSAIAAHEQVPESFVLCGSGAAELIYGFARGAGVKTALVTAPTFSEYALGLRQVGCVPEEYLLREENDFRPDAGILTAIRARKPGALFLCNPNNPTGQLADPELLREILLCCRETGTRLFVDECFLDLTENGVSMKPFLGEYPGLFLLKAFTKSYGMAGVRLGYCLSGDPALLTAISRTEQPWNISTPAQAAGIAALREGAYLRRTVALVREQRTWLTERLSELGFRVIPSRTNYLLFRGPENLSDRLKAKGILIRNCDNYSGLGPGWYRIAVRLPEENRKLIQAMEEAVWQKTS